MLKYATGCTHSFCKACLLRCLELKRECPKCKQTAQPAEFDSRLSRLGGCGHPQCLDCIEATELITRNTDLCAGTRNPSPYLIPSDISDRLLVLYRRHHNVTARALPTTRSWFAD